MSQSKISLDKDLMFQKIMPSTKTNIPEETESSAESLRAKLFSQTPPETMSFGTLKVVNLMEKAVLRYLDETIEKFNCCRCDQCRSDIVAITLNELPPRYAVGDDDHLRELEASIKKKEVLSALVRAVMKVRSQPRH